MPVRLVAPLICEKFVLASADLMTVPGENVIIVAPSGIVRLLEFDSQAYNVDRAVRLHLDLR